ncbi:serologically defined colon cancer antigen 8 isoform X2 [Ailuropoda melanoleuca]|uniref:serologically defined colon cancer antigen 8 isoform X2 n=1 Tax=Ailuropoda melanoleuca TaxID=9646 RepID=UPI001493E17E|nr:serologically defined colon cancer antigen 8 isoform X2 [Ailuropoda melanoleuca]
MLPNDSSGRKQAGTFPAPRSPVPRGATLDTSPRDSHLWAPGLCMAKSPENSTLEEILGQYQRSLRERANRSIHQLQCALREGDVAVGEEAPGPTCNSGVENEDPGMAWHELQHSHAVNQLKALLHQQATKESEVSPSRRRNVSPLRSSEYEEANMPTVYNLVPIINDQSQYIHHLEAEVKFCKEELTGMKNRVQVVVLENERLQQELKSQRQEEAMREQTLLDASGILQNSWMPTGEDSGADETAKRRFSQGNADAVKGPSAGEAEKWKLELERLKLTYEEKGEILESQLKFLRKDLAEYQKNCEDLKERLKLKESLLANMSNRVGGLCLKCAQHEAVLSQTHNNVHMQTIERLTKERDDLMSALVSVRSSLTEVQQREASAYEQVKQAVQVTEEANFEKTKALIQCKQLKNELERQAERLEKELASQQEKRAFEKERMRTEVTKEREDMESKMFSLSQNIAQLEAQVEKVTREKISAINQLEEVQNQLASKEMDVTKEIEKLRSEVSESKQHLEREQQKAARAREECLTLTELLSKSEHQLHLTRLEKDSIQQSLSNEAKAQALQAQQREQELTQKIQQMEAQHDQTENEQYSLLTSQNTFLTKLKEECCALAKKLEQISKKSRSEIAQLSQEKRYTHDKLEKLQRRNDELEEQCVQHGRLHEIMKQRLKQLDKHSQATAQQLVHLLSKQSQLLLERQSLSEEVGRLRSQTGKPGLPQPHSWQVGTPQTSPDSDAPAPACPVECGSGATRARGGRRTSSYPACNNLIADLDETE